MSNEERLEQLINELKLIMKDLGVATAYGYAVEKGYTGTEEEFAELMASYATVAQDAAHSAEQAAESATNAHNSEINAGTSEGHAEQAKLDAQVAKNAAETAQGRAESAESGAVDAKNAAEGSAEDSEAWAVGTRDGSPVGQTDPTYHNNAKYYAELADTKADQAADSASDASDAKDAAVSAKNDAIDAKDAAVSAKNDAVDAKDAAVSAKNDAELAETGAVNAKNDAVDAKDAAVSAKTDAQSAKNDAVSAKNDAVTAKTDAQTAKDQAVTAKNDAQTAKTGADSAKADAISAKNDAVTAKNGAVDAKDAAQAAQAAAEEAATHVADMALMQAIAPKWVNNVPYKIGNLLTYLGKQYYCIADAPAGTLPTNTAYFEEKSVADIIEMIKNGSIQVGSAKEADSLKTSVGVTDNTPFSAETAGGDSDIQTGYQNLNKLVGCKVVKNQIMPKHTSVTVTEDGGVTATVDADGWITITGTATKDVRITPNVIYPNVPANSVVLCWAEGAITGGGVERQGFVKNKNSRYYLSRYNVDWNANARFCVSSGDTVNAKIKLHSSIITLMYGNNDVVQVILGGSLPSTTGSQASDDMVNALLAFDPNILKDTDYDTGSFSECKSASLESVEYNLLEDDWTVTGSNVAYVEKTLTEPIICTGQVIALVATVTGAISPLVSLYDGNTQVAEFFLYQAADGQKCGRGNYPDTDYALPIGTKITKIRFRYDGAGGTSGNFTYSKIAVFNYWDGSRIGYEPYKKHTYPMPNVDLNGILKVVNGKVVADGDELTPDGSGNKKRYKLTTLADKNWEQVTYGGKTYFTYTFTDKATGDDFRIDSVYPFGGNGLAETFESGYIYTSAYNSTVYIYDTSVANVSALQTKLGNAKAIYRLLEEESLSADTFSRNVYMDDFGFISFLDEDGNVIDGLQGNEILYKANVSGFAESLYVRADGDPEFFAEAEDLTDEALNARGYYKMQDLSSGVTIKLGLTAYVTKLIKCGNMVTLCLKLKNETSSDITPNQEIASLPSGTFNTATYGVFLINAPMLGASDSEAMIEFGYYGGIKTYTTIPDGTSIYIYVSYAV